MCVCACVYSVCRERGRERGWVDVCVCVCIVCVGREGRRGGREEMGGVSVAVGYYAIYIHQILILPHSQQGKTALHLACESAQKITPSKVVSQDMVQIYYMYIACMYSYM